jgi:hypothetical protein
MRDVGRPQIPTSRPKKKEEHNLTTIFGKPPGFDALRCGIAVACVFLAPYAFATDARGLSAPTVETDSTLSEIVVTAERREGSVAKSPISIPEFSHQKMGDLHIENFWDLASMVPSLTIQISD